ncbi:unnamed protein product, partial [Meganyctiphanes norvegica]
SLASTYLRECRAANTYYLQDNYNITGKMSEMEISPTASSTWGGGGPIGVETQLETNKVQCKASIEAAMGNLQELTGNLTDSSRLSEELAAVLEAQIGPLRTSRDSASAQAAQGKQHQQNLLQHLQKVVQPYTEDEVSSACFEAQGQLETTQNWTLSTKKKFNLQTPYYLVKQVKQNLSILELLGKKDTYYTIVDPDLKGTRCTCLTVKDGMLHLHALQEAPTPPNSLSLPYKSVRQLVEVSSALLFLDINWPEQGTERIYIRLFGDTPRGQQFLWLCTAEKGPSYHSTSLEGVFNSGKPGEGIVGGNYDNKDASVLIEDLKVGGEYTKPITAGLIAGNVNAKFGIYTRDENTECHVGFGHVEKGLDSLIRGMHVIMTKKGGDVRGVRVVDCGVVVPV